MADTNYEAELRAANEEIYKHSVELVRLKKELEAANAQQESLLHFVSHEIKGYLTQSEAGFAAIVEGDYGAVPEPLSTMASHALASVRRGVSTVIDILAAANMKKGTVEFKKESFNFKAAVEALIAELKPAADEKGLTINIAIGEGNFVLQGDEEKLRHHVIRNLIDNAIKYTPQGSIEVRLSDGDGKIHFSVKDSGVGITPEDKARLFTEGGHGKDSLKVNVHSTGYGLFIAKTVVEAHNGRIWAESEGQGKGSLFSVELPVA